MNAPDFDLSDMELRVRSRVSQHLRDQTVDAMTTFETSRLQRIVMVADHWCQRHAATGLQPFISQRVCQSLENYVPDLGTPLIAHPLLLADEFVY